MLALLKSQIEENKRLSQLVSDLNQSKGPEQKLRQEIAYLVSLLKAMKDQAPQTLATQASPTAPADFEYKARQEIKYLVELLAKQP